MNANINRRRFFKWGMISGGAATLPLWLQKLLPPPIGVKERVPRPQSEEKWLPSVCGKCAAGCGLLVRVVDGRAIGVKGNPNHPINQGALCPKGFTVIQELYHPDRVKTPLKRRGERGMGDWRPISWDEAMQEIVAQLKQLREQGEPHALALLLGPTGTLLRLLFHRFATAFGTPNLLEVGWGMGEGPVDAATAMHGAPITYDLSRAQFVLSFGADWLQAFPSPVEAARAFAQMRRGHIGRRAIVVHIEPRLSVSAIKADEWIPVKPYTEGALALGIAHVLIRENLYDRNFVAKHTFGFEDWTDEEGNWHRGFKSLVLRQYEPAKVAEITGVRVETIVRLAREFAAHKPAVALCDRTRFYDQMAVHSLNALVGNLGVPGGVLTPWALPELTLPPCPQDDIARKGLQQRRLDKESEKAFPLAISLPDEFPDSLLNTPPYEIKALLIHKANPVFISPELGRWLEALRRIPFIVSITSFLDETSEFADIVLPAPTTLESWQEVVTHTLEGVPVVSVSEPVVEPLYETRHPGDVLIQLARAIGGTVAAAFPWESFPDALRESLKGLFETGRGETISPPPVEEESWAEEETKPTLEKWFSNVAKTGGWVDKALQGKLPPLRFGTPSGKFEFYALTLRQKLGKEVSDLVCLPHFEEPDFLGRLGEKAKLWIGTSEKATNPRLLHLYLYTPLVFHGGEGAHLPYLHGIAGAHVNEYRWTTWVEINPETAKELGINDGDEVWVESPIGRIKARARLFPGAQPNVVNMPLGLGHTAYGRWAKGVGSNPAQLLVKVLDNISGQPLWQLTVVRIYKA